jgi:hypothetical protein
MRGASGDGGLTSKVRTTTPQKLIIVERKSDTAATSLRERESSRCRDTNSSFQPSSTITPERLPTRRRWGRKPAARPRVSILPSGVFQLFIATQGGMASEIARIREGPGKADGDFGTDTKVYGRGGTVAGAPGLYSGP